MQPANISLDPAANLWSSNSPDTSLFTSTSSPPSTSNNDRSFGHFGAFQTPDITGVIASGTEPTFSANSPNAKIRGNDGGAGEVFMGMQTPQLDGALNWKWTVMSEKPK